MLDILVLSQFAIVGIRSELDHFFFYKQIRPMLLLLTLDLSKGDIAILLELNSKIKLLEYLQPSYEMLFLLRLH